MPEETVFIEMKLALSKAIKQNRISQQMTQHALVQRIKSSNSRVAKMESGDPSASLDLLVRTLLTFGGRHQDMAEVILNSASSQISHLKRVSIQARSLFLFCHPQSAIAPHSLMN